MQGRKAYVHCWGGVGRTGIVAGCYLIEHGHYTGEAALAQLQLLWRRMSDLWESDRDGRDDRSVRFVVSKVRSTGSDGMRCRC